MSTPLHSPDGFDDASLEERLELVQRLWDRIAEDAAAVPIPDSHRRVLDERLRSYEATPAPGRPWSEVRREILGKLGKN